MRLIKYINENLIRILLQHFQLKYVILNDNRKSLAVTEESLYLSAYTELLS